MKYNITNIVKIKSKEWFDNAPKDRDGDVALTDPVNYFTTGMAKYAGCNARVVGMNTDKEYYFLDIDDGEYVWTDEMLEDAKEELKDATEPFTQITKEMYELYLRKNADYGDSFNRSLDKFGIVASATRMDDKMNRICELIKHDAQVKDESLRDTLRDLANYAVMTIMWMDKHQKGEKE